MHKRLIFSVASLGVTSIITQLLLIREFLNISKGNELIIGITFASWVLLIGIGSLLGKYIDKIKSKLSLLIYAQVMIGILPLFYVFLLRILGNHMTGYGSAGLLIFSFILLAPFCIVSGILIVIACHLFGAKKHNDVTNVILINLIGAVIGGLFFSFIFIHLFNAISMALFLMAINLLSAFILTLTTQNRVLAYSLLAISLISVIFFTGVDLNKLTMQKLYPGEKIIFQDETAQGNLVVTKTNDKLKIYENKILLDETNNTLKDEEVVHFAMSQVPYAARVLLIGGGVSKTPREILKYKTIVDYADISSEIIETGQDYTYAFDDVNIIKQDARRYVQKTNIRYDAIIIDLPLPQNIQLNRFYTVDFFLELKKLLSEGGIISLHINSGPDLTSSDKKVNAAIYRSLHEVFANVIILPGTNNYLVASDKVLDYDITALMKKKNINTEYINEYSLLGKLTEKNIIMAEKTVLEKTQLDTDFRPVAFFYNQDDWLGINSVGLRIIFVFILLFLVIYFSQIKPIPLTIFTSGFTAMGVQIIILLSFQILFGSVYQGIGPIITMFMLGLLLGSYFMGFNIKKMKKRDLIFIEIGIALFCILLPVVIFSAFVKVLSVFMSFLAFLAALLLSLEFPVASQLFRKKKSTSILYTAEFIGGTIGALSVSTFFLPLFGILNTCLFMAFLNMISAFVVWKA